MSKMNREIKARWVAALRSGEYKQGTGELRNGSQFCCLGVLCNLHAQDHPRIAEEEVDAGSYMGCIYLPPDEVTEWAALDVEALVTIKGEEGELYRHNDDGRTFAEIADAIKEQL